MRAMNGISFNKDNKTRPWLLLSCFVASCWQKCVRPLLVFSKQPFVYSLRRHPLIQVNLIKHNNNNCNEDYINKTLPFLGGGSGWINDYHWLPLVIFIYFNIATTRKAPLRFWRNMDMVTMSKFTLHTNKPSAMPKDNIFTFFNSHNQNNKNGNALWERT